MNQNARVRSIDALSRLRAAIGAFAEEAEQALIAVDAEVARAQRIVGEEMPRYWQGELRAREESVVRARIALEHALAAREMGKSSVDERKALARAKQRVETARARLDASKRWRREIDREQLLYAGQVEPLARFARATAPQASEALRRMIDALEQYVSIAPSTSDTLDQDQPNPADLRRAPARHSASPDAGLRPTLEARLPAPDEVLSAKPGTADDLPRLTLTIEDRRRLATLAPPNAPDPRHWILVADTARPHTHVALQRVAPLDPADSGWRMLGLDTQTPAHWRQVPILTILRTRPAILDLLRLPTGITIILEPADEHPIKAAHDPAGTDLWSTIRESPE